MAYDIESDKAILFGGSASEEVDNLKDTWAYDYATNTWAEMSPPDSPGDRAGSTMAYNSKADRIILFGGINTNDVFLDDTWAYDYNTDTWQEMTPPGSPKRAGHAMAYDTESDRVIMFGGGVDFFDVEGTWAYDYNDNIWTEMSPEISPPKDHGHQMAYDSESDRVILWGTLAVFNEDYSVWAYDYNTDTWEEIKPKNGHPKLLAEGAMAYASSAERIILHHSVDLWAYDYNANAWTELKPEKPIPYLLYRHAMVYNANADRIIAFGGETLLGDELGSQTWVYDPQANTWTDMTPVQ
jgi:N-acetylneuraminic acid mutarotase